MRWERELGDSLRELARTVDEVPENPDTEARLLEAFDARIGSKSGRRLRSVQGRLPRKARGVGTWWLAAAATLVLAAGGWWIVARQQAGDSPNTAATFQTAAAARSIVDPVVPGATQPVEARQEPVASQVAAVRPSPVDAPKATASRPARKQAAPPSEVTEEEADAEFVELPAAHQLPKLESGTIVRVELSVASLPAYGLPIMPDAPVTPVTADVLVGQDGQPRAIRLVSFQTGPRRH